MHKVTGAFWILGLRRSRTGFSSSHARSAKSPELIKALANGVSYSKSFLKITRYHNVNDYFDAESDECDNDADLEKVEQERMRKIPFPNCSRTTGWLQLVFSSSSTQQRATGDSLNLCAAKLL